MTRFFLPDGYTSDVYVKRKEHGYVIHVAKVRYAKPLPVLPKLTADTIEEYAAALHERIEFLNSAERIAINLPHAGESYTEHTAKHAIARLKWLGKVGFRVPIAIIYFINGEITSQKQKRPLGVL